MKALGWRFVLAVLLGCAGCLTPSHLTSPSPARPSLLVVVNEALRLGPPEGRGGGFYVLREIRRFIPKQTPTGYDYLRDYARDVQAAIKEAKAKGEDVAGLNAFFGKVLPQDEWARKTMFLPRLVLRCLDRNGNRVWVVHLNWEYYFLPSVRESEPGEVSAGHVVTFVVDYATGAIIYGEQCT